jgi:hypothetical protein
MRTIGDKLIELRSKEPTGKAAICGQPGIGKSYSLFYFAYRFLQVSDVDAVVLEYAGTGYYLIFYSDSKVPERIQVPEELKSQTALPIADYRYLVNKHLLPLSQVVYLVDLGKGEGKRPSTMWRLAGYTVYSSSPGPFKEHLEGERHRLGLKIFCPPPYSKEELKAVYEYEEIERLGIGAWKRDQKRTFDLYFDTFGGTLRPLFRTDEELIRMATGANKLQQTMPNEILRLVRKGTPSSVEVDTTHALFSQVGGTEEQNYVVKFIPTERVFRSKFAEFWFNTYVAPRILFKTYNAGVLEVIYAANREAKGARGIKYEDFFHKLLSLGKWTIKDVPLEKESKDWSHMAWLGSLFGAGGKTSAGEAVVLDFKGIPVKQRTQNDTVVAADLPEEWGKEATKEENRQDVGHLIDVWETQPRFYWLRLGKEFPGIDSVYKDGSKVYFLQVKTGQTANETYRWVAKAYEYSRLLLDQVGNPQNIEVTIVLGTEPSTRPVVLGKRKRDDLITKEFPTSWKVQYIAAPVSSDNEEIDLILDWSRYEALQSEFFVFLSLFESPDKVAGSEEGCSDKKKPATKATKTQAPERRRQ